MSRKMLINAQRGKQLRVAIVDGTTLEDYQVEIAESGLTRGNIYRGVVANIQASLNAAFIDIGEERHGFLSVDDVLPSCYHRQPPKGERRPRIDQVLERGKPILVQVTKDGAGTKGPALNTNIAVAGRYLVLMPYDDVRGISRKVDDDEARKKLKERLAKLNLPDDSGVIVRTNGLDQNQTTLNRDLSALLRLWKRIREAGNKGRGPRLLYSDQDLFVQALRDYCDNTIEQVIVDTDEAYAKAEEYMSAFMPRSKTKLIRYEERLPLFARYRLENQIDSIYERVVPLPSGGSVVIEGTEALTSIDVNSGRATKTADHDESIFKVNSEAAAEVARQLRLRDIGGLVVVDFIDMRLRKHQRKLEKTTRDSMKNDRARHSVTRISPNGLVEINRQRLKQALHLRTHRPCPTCKGTGTIASLEFAASSLLRRVEARAAGGMLKSVVIGLHPEVADALQNQHRSEIHALEEEFDIRIEIIAAPNLHRTEERVEWRQTEHGSGNGRTPQVAALGAADVTVPGAQRYREEVTVTDEEKASRRRRRRRGGSRSDDAEAKVATSADATRADEAVEASDDAENGDGTERRRRRRGRRGGRRRRRGAEDTGDEQLSLTTESPEGDRQADSDDEPTRPRRTRPTEASEPRRGRAATDEADEPRPRRRRRRPDAEGEDDGPRPRRRRRVASDEKQPGNEIEAQPRPRKRRGDSQPGNESEMPSNRRKRKTRLPADAKKEQPEPPDIDPELRARDIRAAFRPRTRILPAEPTFGHGLRQAEADKGESWDWWRGGPGSNGKGEGE
ncbi:MAG: Rne/Rng family ribonuclease, partial [Acidobacteriota bacterium]